MDHWERIARKSTDWLIALNAWARYDEVLSHSFLHGTIGDPVVQAALADLHREAVRLTEESGVETASGRVWGLRPPEPEPTARVAAALELADSA